MTGNDDTAAASPGLPETLTEEEALALLARRDLSRESIEKLVRYPGLMKSRRVVQAVIAHPHTPKHISLPRARDLYTFELMNLSLSPAVAADVKLAAEDVILSHLGTVTAGERLTLAKRASLRIAAALLLDAEERVMSAALGNGRVTEEAVVRALQSPRATLALVDSVCRHERWSLRRDIRIALLRSPYISEARAHEFAAELPANVLAGLVDYVGPEVRSALQAELRRRNHDLTTEDALRLRSGQAPDAEKR
jgi:hypothetical protein